MKYYLIVIFTFILSSCSKVEDVPLGAVSSDCSQIFPKELADAVQCKKVSGELEDKYNKPSCIRNGFFSTRKKGDNRWGILKENGDILVDFTLKDEPSYFSEGFARFEQDGKYGFLDSDGEVAINPQYEDLQSFSSGGLAGVMINSKWGFIDTGGNIAIEPKYDNVKKFSDGLAAVTVNKKKGYINPKGDVVIPFDFSFAGSFREKRAAVRKDGLFGYINTEGDFVVDGQYDNAYPFIQGLAIVRRDKKYGIIDCNGNEILPTKYKFIMNISDLKDPKKHFYQVVENKKSAIFFPNSNKMTDFEFDTIVTAYNNKIAAAKNDRWGAINFDGEIVEPFTHKKGGTLENGDFELD